MNIHKATYPHRFIIFLVSLIAVLFGSLFIPPGLHELLFGPLFFIINILAGTLLISEKKGQRRIFLGMLLLTLLSYILAMLFEPEAINFTYVRFTILFLFYSLVTLEIISQVWRSKRVNKTVILGLISGYICLGLLGFFICTSIELIAPGSFNGLVPREVNANENTEGLVYFSYITLLTIGYGDITPVTRVARSAAMLIGLLGQFYLVIITAIVVGKFISQSNIDLKKE